MSGLYPQIVPTGKTEIFIAPYDFNLRISLLYRCRFILLRGIIYHYHLHFVIEGDGLNQCTGVLQPIIIDGDDR